MAAPSIPPEFRNAIFESQVCSGNPLYCLTDGSGQPVSGQEHLDRIYIGLRESASAFDETTDPGLGADKMLGGQTCVDEGALRTDPATPSLWEKLKSGR